MREPQGGIDVGLNGWLGLRLIEFRAAVPEDLDQLSIGCLDRLNEAAKVMLMELRSALASCIEAEQITSRKRQQADPASEKCPAIRAALEEVIESKSQIMNARAVLLGLAQFEQARTVSPIDAHSWVPESFGRAG